MLKCTHVDAIAVFPVHELVYQGLKVISEWLTTSEGYCKLELLSRISVAFSSLHIRITICHFVIRKNPCPIFLGLKILAGQSSQPPSIEAVAEQFARPGA